MGRGGVLGGLGGSRSDSIDASELGAVMRAMGQKLSAQRLDAMIASVDADGSGEIDFPEFCGLLGIKSAEPPPRPPPAPTVPPPPPSSPPPP